MHLCQPSVIIPLLLHWEATSQENCNTPVCLWSPFKVNYVGTGPSDQTDSIVTSETSQPCLFGGGMSGICWCEGNVSSDPHIDLHNVYAAEGYTCKAEVKSTLDVCLIFSLSPTIFFNIGGLTYSSCFTSHTLHLWIHPTHWLPAVQAITRLSCPFPLKAQLQSSHV